jgi:DNA-binding transcriptional regulator GbsR (MarR family)
LSFTNASSPRVMESLRVLWDVFLGKKHQFSGVRKLKVEDFVANVGEVCRSMIQAEARRKIEKLLDIF